jgi:hypothetical protein
MHYSSALILGKQHAMDDIDERYSKLRDTIKQALRDCAEKHPEWFATGDVRAIERSVLEACKPFLIDTLQLSFSAGVLHAVYHAMQPDSE